MELYKYERVKKICEDVSSFIPVQSIPIVHWKMKKGFFLTPAEVDASQSPWMDFNTKSNFWPGPDAHYWFRTIIDVPQSFNKKPLWLNFVTQCTFWDAVNPQFLIFVNGEPLQGLDVNHRELHLSDKAKAGDHIVIELQGYTGRDNDHNQGSTDHLQLMANMFEPSEDVNRLYYNLSVPNQIVSHLDKDHPSRIKLQAALEKAVNLLDLRAPHSTEFYASVEECNRFLESEIYKKLAFNDEVIATCVGHTHIDIAWWWTVEQTREKAVRSFATVLRYMEDFPDYKFMSSQPQLYQFVKERYPAIYEKIRKRIKEGRWEPEGGMWVEADCNVTSGESLVRQFLHGKKFFKEEFDKENKILWLPDVFGYSAALPQIMRKSGIDYFMTTKIAWNQFNKLPVDTFWWRGIDGSEVLTHLITTQDIHQPKDSFYTTYNGNLNPISVMRAWERYQQKEWNNDVLISYGFGDGGGGPTREMLETGKRMKNGITGAPKVRQETSRKFFDDLYKKVGNDPTLPRWVGELYLEYHRGTYTSMARNKRSNRKCELLLQDAEFFSVFASLFGEEIDAAELYKAWELLLLNQFHDILPGSSIKEVYDVTRTEYDQLEARLGEIISQKIISIASNVEAHSDALLVFNSLSHERGDSVFISAEDYPNATHFEDENGERYPVQHTSGRQMVFSPKGVPAKGYAIYRPCLDRVDNTSEIVITTNTIDTPFYKITLDKAGQFTSIFDKEAGRELLKMGEKGNVLMVYEDKPIYYDNWDIDIYYTQKSWAVEDVTRIEWVENGPVRAVLRIDRSFLDSKIVQKIIFYPDNRRIDFDTYVDWKQHQLLLKCEFPIDINTSEATYDIQFGNVKRPTHKNTSWEAAKFEVCGHKWADLSENGYGVALMNDCKYGYGITDGKMTLSLIKSGILPNPTTDQEEHRFVYSLLPHMGGYIEGGVQEQAYCLNVPMRSLPLPRASGEKGSASPKSVPHSLVTLDASNVVLETIKPAVDGKGVILRMYESQNKRTNVTLKWHTMVTSITECDLMENDISPSVGKTDRVTVTMKPFEIKTYRIK